MVDNPRIRHHNDFAHCPTSPTTTPNSLLGDSRGHWRDGRA
ncbi:hypothetical protein [Nostoc sp. UHCC 0252]|nr:hypothetical protein [Nostoc sp. UHCC 0252]MEA5603399.1 hypothetical protein [Nostoc sp. UHCC 0252]